ncbi:hypothetical protein F9K98_10450 [Brucella anthropi]|uniref:hypothetical protein n=1 Tax=Brucella anthropi TaxID=529 RepID=UPI00124EE3EB|nr:hypothetical protein [Brucella anthropi]KAB2762252.1 hypothetical protein F9K98_10450 [Brucella anthropi]
MKYELKSCPFCAKPLTVRNGVNPYGRCDTEGCWMAEAKIGISCDDPKQVERWNTRPTPVATPADATDEMVDAALAVDWDNEDERATVHNIWHAMTAHMPTLVLVTPVSPDATGKCGELVTERRSGGYYWIKGSDGWEPWKWTSKGWTNEFISIHYTDEEMGSIGPLIPSPDELVTRSQAVELLAEKEAERAEQWRLRREMEADRDTQKAIAASLEVKLAAANEKIEEAYRLGHLHGRCGGTGPTEDDDWKEARAALGGKP